MAYTQRKLLISPATRNCMNVGAADSASLNLDINIVVPKRLGRVFVFVEFSPRFRTIDLEACESFRVNHCCLMRLLFESSAVVRLGNRQI